MKVMNPKNDEKDENSGLLVYTVIVGLKRVIRMRLCQDEMFDMRQILPQQVHTDQFVTCDWFVTCTQVSHFLRSASERQKSIN